MAGTNAPSGGVVADRLGKRFGSNARWVLRGVDLRVAPGRCAAVLGPPGAGKSVLVRCLAGSELASRGAVRVGGVDPALLDEPERTEFRRTRVGVVHPEGNLLPELSVQDNLLLPLDTAGLRPDFARLELVLDRLAIRDLVTRRPHRLGRAEQRRVALARALVQGPDVLLVDEPVGGVDPVTGRHLLRVLRKCADEFGLAVLLVSEHPSAAVYADQVYELRDGRVVPDRQQDGCGCGAIA